MLQAQIGEVMRLIFSILVLAISTGVLAQSTSSDTNVKGLVQATVLGGEEGQLEPLIGASVYWKDSQVGTSTDINGRFEIAKLKGHKQLVFSFTGFQSQTITYTGQAEINVVMKVGEELGAAEVQTVKNSTEMSLINPLNIQVLDEKELCKAACCNLSESFETNASVDASFTDAVTGTKQIRMLGLDGKYSQITKDNIPLIRGLSTIYGLNYVPGPWIQSIQISKGVGSVSGGYESITGQINVAIKSPETSEKLHVNAFVNQAGRVELNTVMATEVNEYLSTSLLTHGEFIDRRWDMNGDGFIDEPLKKDVILRNEWMLRTKRVFGSYQVTYLVQDQTSGQMDFQPNSESAGVSWGASMQTERIEAHAKTGYVYPESDWKSFGSQLSFSQFSIKSVLGGQAYEGFQRSYRANLLYASRINEFQRFVLGASYLQDEFQESFRDLDFSRVEKVPGVFAEYTWSKPELFAVVAGMRVDEHNLYGTLMSPRLHARYSINENVSVKVGAGIGHRTANIVMENVGLQASNRAWIIHGDANEPNFGLPMEQATNVGVNYLQKFRLFYRDASMSVDYYRTQFQDQLVIDLDANTQEVNIYALDGVSYSNSAQWEMHVSPFKRFDVRLAYRWLDVKNDFAGGLNTKPLVANHRAFTNLAYETKTSDEGGQWRFDATAQWTGEARIPDTSTNPEGYQLKPYSNDFVTFNAQVTRVFFEGFEVYLGGENLTSFRQPNPILSAENPFGEFFDASMVWGPVFGRMVYAGLRWEIE